MNEMIRISPDPRFAQYPAGTDLVMTTVWHRSDQGWKVGHLHESTPLQ